MLINVEAIWNKALIETISKTLLNHSINLHNMASASKNIEIWNTIEMPLKYHSKTIDLPLIYHWNTI